MFAALMAGVLDETEAKRGHRCDGAGADMVNFMNTVATGLSFGIPDLLIRGCVQPRFNAAGRCVTSQPETVIRAIVRAFAGMNIFIHLFPAFIHRFPDAGKNLPDIQKKTGAGKT